MYEYLHNHTIKGYFTDKEWVKEIPTRQRIFDLSKIALHGLLSSSWAPVFLWKTRGLTSLGLCTSSTIAVVVVSPLIAAESSCGVTCRLFDCMWRRRWRERRRKVRRTTAAGMRVRTERWPAALEAAARALTPTSRTAPIHAPNYRQSSTRSSRWFTSTTASVLLLQCLWYSIENIPSSDGRNYVEVVSSYTAVVNQYEKVVRPIKYF